MTVATRKMPITKGERALSYRAPRTLEIAKYEPSEPGSREVQVEVAFNGICGTDLHIFHGAMDARVKPPSVIGHEMSGVVAAIGAGVEDITVGERVTVMPLDWCDSCPACVAGHTHICHNLKFLGIDTPGAMQTRWNVPRRAVLSLPVGLSLKEAALTEPTAVAVHDVRRAQLREGDRALVVGGGPIGLLIAAVARSFGADVVVMEPNTQRRALAESLNFTSLNPADTGAEQMISDWTGGAGVTVAFEVSGVAEGVESAIQALATRGRLVIVAIHTQPPPVNLRHVFWRELTLLGARVYERRDFDEAMRLLEMGQIPTQTLITDVVPLAEAARAFEALERGEAMKILVDCASGESL